MLKYAFSSGSLKRKALQPKDIRATFPVERRQDPEFTHNHI